MMVAGLELTRIDAITLLAQRLAGLGAGVVELARLADDDRAGAALWRSSTPLSASSRAQLSAVWPPIVGSTASGFSLAMMRSTVCQLIGSMYTASAISGSVMMVAGLELTRMTRYPSSRSALQACAPE